MSLVLKLEIDIKSMILQHLNILKKMILEGIQRSFCRHYSSYFGTSILMDSLYGDKTSKPRFMTLNLAFLTQAQVYTI